MKLFICLLVGLSVSLGDFAFGQKEKPPTYPQMKFSPTVPDTPEYVPNELIVRYKNSKRLELYKKRRASLEPSHPATHEGFARTRLVQFESPGFTGGSSSSGTGSSGSPGIVPPRSGIPEGVTPFNPEADSGNLPGSVVQENSNKSSGSSTESLKGEFIKMYKREKDPKSRGEFLNAQQEILETLGQNLMNKYQGAFEKTLHQEGLLGTQLLKTSSNEDIARAIKLSKEETPDALDKLIETIQKDPNVSSVSKNYNVYPLGHHPDPLSPPDDALWREHNPSTNKSLLWGLEKIQAHLMWREANVFSRTDQGEKSVIAFIDSGYIPHSDLPDKVLWKHVGRNFIESTSSTLLCENSQNHTDRNYLKDETGHGQGVMGVAMAALNNQGGTGTELAGVAGTGQVKAMVLKIYCNKKIRDDLSTNEQIDQDRSTLDMTLDAMEFASKNGAQVINFSSSLPGGITESQIQTLSQTLDEIAVTKTLFVASAGNDGDDHDSGNWKVKFPAGFHGKPNVMIVGASTFRDFKRHNSDWGSRGSVHVFAPGQTIRTTVGLDAVQSSPGETSAAASFVSGCAGFLQAEMKVAGKDYLPPKDLKQLIIETAESITLRRDQPQKGPRLNCHKAYKDLKSKHLNHQ